MKMIFIGGKKRLLPIWATFDNVLLKQYWKEVRDGTIKYGWDGEDKVFIETSNQQFISEMKKDFNGLKGRVKRASLRFGGIKVEIKE